MTSSLEDILISIQHHDQGIRRSGEILYHQLQESPEYVRIVTSFASDGTRPTHFRQLVILLLNQQVSKDWRSFGQASKETLVQFTFTGCCCDVTVIRHASMHMLSKIVSRSVSSESKEIIAHLSRQLLLPDILMVTSTLRCLCAIAEEDCSLLIEIIQLCYTRVQEIILTADPSNIQLLKYSTKLMGLIIQKFSVARMACELDKEAISVIEKFLPMWTNTSLQWLSLIHSVHDISSRLIIVLEFLRFLSVAFEAFPDECAAFFSDMMQTAWSFLCLLRNRKEIGREAVSGYSSDGERIDFEILTIQLFELICMGLSSGNQTQSLLGGDLNQLISSVTEHMILSSELQQQWMEDGNEFVASEQEDSSASEFSVRQSGADLIARISKEGKERAFQFIFSTTFAVEMKYLIEFNKSVKSFSNFSMIDNILSNDSKKALELETILKIESTMWCFGSMGAAYIRFVKFEERYCKRGELENVEGGSVEVPKGREAAAIDVINAIPKTEMAKIVFSFIQIILLDPYESNHNPHPAHAVLRGRAIWLFCTYVAIFDTETVILVSKTCLHLMEAHNPLSVRLQACRAIGSLLHHISHASSRSSSTTDNILIAPLGKPEQSQGIEAFHAAIINAVLNLVSEMTESTLHFALETITAILKYPRNFITDKTALIDLESAINISQMGLKVLSVYSTDPLLLDVTKDMLCALIDLNQALGVIAVFQTCGLTFKKWLSNVILYNDNDDNNDSSNTNNNGNIHLNDNFRNKSNVSASLLDVSIELLGRMSLSASLKLITGQSLTGMPPGGIVSATDIISSALDTLLSSLNIKHFPSRRECMQTINMIFSGYNGAILQFFNSSALLNPIPNRNSNANPFVMSSATFSKSLSDVILQSLTAIESDPEVGDCSGPTIGLLCHLLTNFHALLDISIINTLLMAVLKTLSSTSSYVRYSSVMGLVHLFARNAVLLANPSSPLLGSLPASPSSSSSPFSSFSHVNNTNDTKDENDLNNTLMEPTEIFKQPVSALGFVLEQWCSLHVHLTTRYNGLISTLGLIELIKLFNMNTSNHGFALKMLQLALSTLPRILLHPAGVDDDMEGNVGGFTDQDEYDGDLDCESEGSNDGDWGSEEEEYEEDDMDPDVDGDKSSSPFAPAEMYLSDMIGKNNSNGDNEEIVIVNVSNNLIFSPPSSDPLSKVDLQDKIIDMLIGLRSIDSTGMFPSWMGALSPQDQQLVQALLGSR